MITRYEVIKTETITDEFNGKPLSIQIGIAWAYDDLPVDVDFGSEEENQKYIRRFETGELLNVCLKVTAQALGEVGTDYLGACHVKAQTMETELIEVATDQSMIQEAILALKANLKCAIETLKPYMVAV